MKALDTLRNGATVIAVGANHHGDEFVLAHNGSEYVTWAFKNPTGDDTYWGHYFNEFEDAVTDFYQRTDVIS